MSKNMIGQNQDIFKATDENSYCQTPKKYLVISKENRTIELHVGKGYYVFSPYGRAELDENTIKHPDFIQQEKLFVVRSI